jgi:hypothetical protein
VGGEKSAKKVPRQLELCGELAFLAALKISNFSSA